MALKRLGQNFLISQKKIRKIVEAAEPEASDFFIEIGPGHGELTRELIKKFDELGIKDFKILAIEKDEGLAERLKFSINAQNLEIASGDALKILGRIIKRNGLKSGGYKIIGNIPYYITGSLLRLVGELKEKPKLAVFTLQKEVGERICALPPKMNLLAASIQIWAKPQIIGSIPKKFFRPEPKVDGVIIKLKIDFQKNVNQSYFKFIRILFKQPRKTIWNNIKYQISKIKNKEEIIERFKKFGIDLGARPQDLSIEQIIKLSRNF